MHEANEGPPEPGGEKKFKVVYTIVDRGGERRPVWVRIGAAFVNRDQSINVKLDAVPVSGTLHIRDYVPMDDQRGRRSDDNQPYRAQQGG